MSRLSEKILKSDDRERTRVEVPLWGCVGDDALYVCGPTARDREQHLQLAYSQEGDDERTAEEKKKDVRAKLLVFSLRDKEDSRVFSEAEITALMDRNARIVENLFDIALPLWGFTAGDVESLVKKCSASPE